MPRAALAALEPARQRNLLRYLLRVGGLGTPSARKIERAARSVARVAFRVAHARALAERRRARISRSVVPLGAAAAAVAARLRGAASAWARRGSAPKAASSSHRRTTAAGCAQSWIERGLTLRFRAGGERFRPHGREHRHSLKHLFQEEGVVPWMRERRAAPLSRRGARRDRRPLDRRRCRRGARERAALERAMDAASDAARAGTGGRI